MIEPLQRALTHYEELRQEEENVKRDPNPNDSGNYLAMLSYKENLKGGPPQDRAKRKQPASDDKGGTTLQAKVKATPEQPNETPTLKDKTSKDLTSPP